MPERVRVNVLPDHPAVPICDRQKVDVRLNTRSQYPSHERDLPDQIGDREAERNPDDRRQTKLEHLFKMDPPQRKDKKDDERKVEDVYGVSILRQKPAEPSRAIKEAPEERNQA